EKSVIMLLRCGLAMSDYEIMAIRWHMTAWDLPFQSTELRKNLNTSREICPLCTIIQAGDNLAAGILEKKVEEEDDDYFDF
ncbi:MAG: HD family phosphohydrolase, partial [Bacteroidales bacterium]|nr:HD family phosphohydrolase [Bacteroidales bacterium]